VGRGQVDRQRSRWAVTIHSRNGHDVTDCYPELLTIPAGLAGRSAVLDTEIVSFDETGRCDFQWMQRRMNVHRPSRATVAATAVVLVVFDVMWLDGDDLTRRPLSARRELLETFGFRGSHWQLTTRLGDSLDLDLREACRAIGIEGLVVKGDGPYRPGERSRDWVKVKFRRTLLAVIGGDLKEKSRYGSLAVGAFHRGAFRYIGQIGNSLTHAHSDALERCLGTLEQGESPFVDLAAPSMTFRPARRRRDHLHRSHGRRHTSPAGDGAGTAGRDGAYRRSAWRTRGIARPSSGTCAPGGGAAVVATGPPDRHLPLYGVCPPSL
jgi:bifunctional non-homologous end joining protein LigD